jgi:hypothetical protein
MNCARFMIVVAVAFAVGSLSVLGGCAQRVAVRGNPDQLFAEAKGALESEGFRPMSAHSSAAGAKGSSLAEGRLQFLYYADNIVPTVVEVNIEPEPGSAVRARASVAPVVAADPTILASAAAGHAGGAPTDAERTAPLDAESAGSPVSGSGASPSKGSAASVVASAAGSGARKVVGAYSIAISAWSSLTYAPDPWISDLATSALRRAFLLSGNIR